MIALSSDNAGTIGIIVYVLLYILLLRQSELVIPSSISDYLKDFWGYRWFFFWIGIKAAVVFGLFVLLTVYIPIFGGKPLIVITQ